MERKEITINIKEFPRVIRPYFENAKIYDSSSSTEFRTLYIR